MIESRSFRRAAGQFATGVTVIAMEAEGGICAMTANSFSSVSLDPPLVLFCVAKGSRVGQMAPALTGFSVNILTQDQQDLSSYFAGIWKDALPPRYAFRAWEGGPRLEGCVASLGCAVHAVQEGGDHWIVLGHVVAVHQGNDGVPPLVFYQGRYAGLDAPVGPPDDQSLLIAWAGPFA